MLKTVQTFFVDPSAVQNADNISITSVDLYFKAKPNRTTNESGIANPGVAVGICSIDTGTGVVTILDSVRKGYDEVYDSSTSEAVTSFFFSKPIIVSTNKSYGVIILPEDGGYEVWVNRAGDRVTGTNDPSNGPTTNKNSQLYSFSGNVITTPLDNTQIKFNVNVAKFVDTSVTIDLVNQPYEFLSIGSRVNTFTGGEYVYANTPLLSGSLGTTSNSNIITGNGTDFTTLTVDRPIVISSNALAQVVFVTSIANSTYMTVGSPVKFTNTAAQYRNGIVGKVVTGDYVVNKITLVGSSANSSAYFANGQLIAGEVSQSSGIITAVNNIPVDRFVAHIDATATLSGTVSSTYTLSFSNGSSYIVANTFSSLANGQQQTQDVTRQYILSRSNEVLQPYLYTDNKSAVTKITLTSSNDFAAPVLNDRSTDMIVYQNQVSNTYLGTYANGVTFDSEVTYNGLAVAKHITKKMTFDAERKAEDLVVYASAYRPLGTHVRYYARLYNSDDSEPFDDKLWTPLQYKSNADLRSSVDKHDFIEYQLGLPQFPSSQSTINGKFTTTNNSNVLTAVGIDPTTLTITSGQPVKIYNELFPTNYMITTIIGVTSTTITVKQPVTDGSIIGAGQKIDFLNFGQTAFNNKSNSNIARYFNSAGAVFDKFNAVQIKVVLLSDTTNVVPEVDQLEVIGVSA